ncbi:nuclear transport factor 2 family protein [Azospirillum sp. YIM B02556]|uniref:Nuclear transport factor 2 family protein n=1 Tax=Azospirillum endophyticum TaxID=2800326 RepID=A0ABS1F0V7_9PROT|nr:nuclear transport factor 2 family protein [Azospirillum endophyticum]MBK1837050.1 nuclear transport factor 2 family protein [Azospirillum endophyticum]
MTQKDLTWLRTLYDRYGVGEVQAVFDHLSPDVEWVSNRESPVFASFSGTFHGVDGVRRYFDGLTQDWSIDRHDLLDMTVEGDDVRVRNLVGATYRKTGRRVETVTHHRLRVRDGRIERFEEQLDDAVVAMACEAGCDAGTGAAGKPVA